MALRCLRVVAYLVAVLAPQVIPMTTRVGLIEWMDNTAVLKETMYEQLTDAERCVQAPRGAHRRQEVRTVLVNHRPAGGLDYSSAKPAVTSRTVALLVD